LHSIDRTAAWLLAGFLIMFFIQRFFHFHHHDVPEESPEGVAGCCDAEHEHGHPESKPGPRHHEHTLADKSARHLSWGGAALGLTLHTLIDGIALGASVEVARDHREGGVLLGFGIFLVIILHKPFDALAISTLMASGGWSKRARHVVNALFSLAIPAGVLVFYLGASQYRQGSDVFVGSALAFAAGTFICIAASDLLPELQFHAHDRGKLSVALIAGLLLAAVIGRFETSGHDRHHDAEEVESVGGNNHSSDARPAKKP
jgi:zinc and cadmium transporter